MQSRPVFCPCYADRRRTCTPNNKLRAFRGQTVPIPLRRPCFPNSAYFHASFDLPSIRDLAAADFALGDECSSHRVTAGSDGGESEGLVEYVALDVTAAEQVVFVADGQHEIDGPAVIALMEGPETLG